jgi:hypothetical protein
MSLDPVFGSGSMKQRNIRPDTSLALDKYEERRDYSVTNIEIATLQRRTAFYDSTRN